MTSIHTYPRERSRWPWMSMAALILALTALSGCVRGPLVAPSQQMFLVDPAPRALGPLQPASESDVQIYTKDVPAGTSAMERTSFDMDAEVRVGDEHRSIDVRVVGHQGRIRRVQALAASDEGISRLRIEYLRDGEINLVGDEQKTETSAVDGKTYLVEFRPHGASVLTAGGATPSPDEATILLDDIKSLPLAFGRARQDIPVSSEFVARATHNALVEAGLEVTSMKATLKGVREIAGVRCAIFDLHIAGVLRKTKLDENMVVDMTLSGEYAFQLADGWEAELFLTGTTWMTGDIVKEGHVIPIHAAGLARFHSASTYGVPRPPASDAMAVR